MELPLELNQPFQGYNHLAFEYGILLLNEEHLEYLYRYTIEMIAYLKHHENIVFLPRREMMGENGQPLKMVVPKMLERSFSDKETERAFIHNVRQMLDQGWYLYENFDEYYVPQRFEYGEAHYIHNFLINGYDDANFYVWGYTKRRKFEMVPIAYRIIYDALMAVQGKENLRFVRLNQEFHYRFHLAEIKQSMMNYLLGNAAYDFGEGTECGIDLLKFFLEDLKNNCAYLDLKYFRIIADHKKAMFNRIRYLFETYSIGNAQIMALAAKIDQSAHFSFAYYLKSTISKRNTDLQKSIAFLQDVITLEGECYSQLIELL